MRQTLPVSWEMVTVPFYPEPDDVVIVACADGENYISLIKSVQERDKTVKRFYYIEDPANPSGGLYVGKPWTLLIAVSGLGTVFSD